MVSKVSPCIYRHLVTLYAVTADKPLNDKWFEFRVTKLDLAAFDNRIFERKRWSQMCLHFMEQITLCEDVLFGGNVAANIEIWTTGIHTNEPDGATHRLSYDKRWGRNPFH